MDDAAAQRDAANALAREEAGALVDAAESSGKSGGGGGGSGGSGEKKRSGEPESAFVRLPCEGYGPQRFATEVGLRLRDKNIFRMGRTVVVVDEETGEIEQMDADWFRTEIARYMVPAKFIFDTKTGNVSYREMGMSKDVAGTVLKSSFFLEHLRPLMKVNRERMPIIRRIGPDAGKLVLLQSGYDGESRVYTLRGALEIDESMTLDKARRFYCELMEEFPLGDFREPTPEDLAIGMKQGKSRSLSVHFANLVSLYGSGLLSELASRMHFVYVANAQRSGKTLLAKIVTILVFGGADVQSLPKDDMELRKLLDSAARANDPYFFLDDLEGRLNSTALNAFMTSPVWKNRLFNRQVNFRAPKQTVVMITGNNLGLSTDIANRTLRCQLYTAEADAQARKIRRVIDEEYLAKPDVRRDALSALWCFIRDWDKKGRPRGQRVLKGFEAWCGMFGGVVENAGFGDPIEAPPKDDFSGDTESADMETLVQALVAEMDQGTSADPGKPLDKKEFTFDRLIDFCEELDCFSWMIQGTRKSDKDTGEKWTELTAGARSAFGKMFAGKYGGRRFTLPDGRVATFGKRGRNRHRRYEVEVRDPSR
ncbi:MAG: hypothetical protein LBO05_04105 [Deltaproteobacteria bacterium]|jgi:hypothetical protein|nr:hypothetical protein [Deltaproteobacteria bacterium]